MNMERHDRARELLMQLLDGELHGAQAEEARRLIEQDPALRTELEAHQRLQRALRGMPSPELPRGFDSRLIARLDEPQGFLARAQARWREWMLPLCVATAAAAAGVLMMVQPGGMVGSSSTSGGVAGASVVSQPAGAVEVTVRVRAGRSHLPTVQQAMKRAGVPAGELVNAGRLAAIESVTTGEGASAVMRELSQVSSVEIIGALPGADVPVKLRVVLTQP